MYVCCAFYTKAILRESGQSFSESQITWLMKLTQVASRKPLVKKEKKDTKPVVNDDEVSLRPLTSHRHISYY
jgi:hypothetical protein